MSPPSGSPPRLAPRKPALPNLPAGGLFPLLLLLLLAVYSPALGGGLLWDDIGHLTRADLRSLDGLCRIWFEIGATQQYYPLLHSAFWLEHKLWGDATLGYHLVNVLQHATAAFLLAILLRRLAVPGAAIAALLFALHPVCVESVAWISEQKNTLSAVFYLAAALAYLRFAESEGEGEGGGERASRRASGPHPHSRPHFSQRAKRAYALATLLFACALLTKTVTATLPAALLVVLWWRQGRIAWRRDILPLLPWFALSLAAGLFTAHFERTLIGAQGAAFDLTLIERFLLAARVPWFYLSNLLWPSNLTFIYPRWTVDATVWWQWLFPLATLALLIAFTWLARTRRPVAANVSEPLRSPSSPASSTSVTASTTDRSPPPPHSGLSALGSGLSTLRVRRAPLAVALLFGGTLFPVLGFFNVYPFIFSYVADHFQYLASLAVFALAGAVLARLLTRLTRIAAAASIAALLLVLGALTWSQAGTYRDAETLYRATLARNPSAWMAHNNLAILLTGAGRPAEAIPHLEHALLLRPDYPQALSNLADNLTLLGRPQEAIARLERALALQPDFVEAHNNLGNACLALDRESDALRSYQKAVELDPNYATARHNLGLTLARLNRVQEAIPHFRRALALQPSHAEAALSLAFALMSTQGFAASIPHFERALELAPESVNAHQTYARALARHGRLEQALSHFRTVVEFEPQSGAAHLDLAQALRRLGRTDEAQHHFVEAQRLGAR